MLSHDSQRAWSLVSQDGQVDLVTTAAPARSWPGALRRLARAEILLAVAAFLGLCAAALSVAPKLVEPDNLAYQASIVGITEGHLLTLSTAQAGALARHLSQLLAPAARPRRCSGYSYRTGGGSAEKDPGYPFLAVVFPGAGPDPARAAVLRRARLPGPVRRRAPVAGPLRRHRGRGLVLLLGRGHAVRLARLHAHVHRRRADRGGHRDADLGRPGGGRPAGPGGPGPGWPRSSPWRRRRSPGIPTSWSWAARRWPCWSPGGCARPGCPAPPWPGGWARPRGSARLWPSSTAWSTAAR